MRIVSCAVLLASVPACPSSPKPPTTPTNATTKPGAPPTGPIGTANPIVIEASDPDGRWVVACQARTDTDGDGKVGVHVGLHGDTYGDDMAPYLIVGTGAGEPIDAFVDQSTDGAWLAAIVKDQLVVIDGKTGARTTIADADVRDDDYPSLAPRAAAFAGANRIVFMRHRSTGDVAVSRDLATGHETEVAVPGSLWRVEPDAAGTWVRAITVRKDTDKSGSLEWPSQHTSLSARGCRGPITSYGTYGASGDEPDLVWIGFDGAGVVDDAAAISVAGPALVRVAADKSLTIGDRVALPAGCDPTVRATIADPPSVLAGCGATKSGKLKLVLATPGAKPRELGVEVEKTDGIVRLAPGDRLACLDGTLCVDVATGGVLEGSIVYADGDRVLVQRTDDQYVLRTAGGGDTVLGKLDGYATVAAGPVVAIGASIVDLAAGKILGTVDGVIEAVDRSGRALVTIRAAGDSPGPDIPKGPAKWTPPK